VWWYNDQVQCSVQSNHFRHQLPHSICDNRWGLDWWIDLLTICRSKLQITITLSQFPHFTAHENTQLYHLGMDHVENTVLLLLHAWYIAGVT
jgi:hypothetical protein